MFLISKMYHTFKFIVISGKMKDKVISERNGSNIYERYFSCQ